MVYVLLFEWLVPDRGVAAERTAGGDVERHPVIDLVDERIDLRVVHLMRVELRRPLALLRMPELVEDGRTAQASQLSVVGEGPRERREVPAVAAEPVTAEAPRPVGEGVGNLQVAKPHGKVATGVLGDVQDQQQPRPLRAPRGERRVR